MLLLVICFLYATFTRIGKITPVFSFGAWTWRTMLQPFFSGMRKLFKRKPKVQEVIQDAFAVPIKDKKAVTLGERLADKGGDSISTMITELGKQFADVDIRVKAFFIILLNVFFVTGLIQHLIWMWQYREITLIAITLLPEFIAWTKATYKKPTPQPHV